MFLQLRQSSTSYISYPVGSVHLLGHTIEMCRSSSSHFPSSKPDGWHQKGNFVNKRSTHKTISRHKLSVCGWINLPTAPTAPISIYEFLTPGATLPHLELEEGVLGRRSKCKASFLDQHVDTAPEPLSGCLQRMNDLALAVGQDFGQQMGFQAVSGCLVEKPEMHT